MPKTKLHLERDAYGNLNYLFISEEGHGSCFWEVGGFITLEEDGIFVDLELFQDDYYADHGQGYVRIKYDSIEEVIQDFLPMTDTGEVVYV